MIVPIKVSCAKQLIKETCGYFTKSIYTPPPPTLLLWYKYYDILVVLSCSLLLEINKEIKNKHFTQAFLIENSSIYLSRSLIEGQKPTAPKSIVAKLFFTVPVPNFDKLRFRSKFWQVTAPVPYLDHKKQFKIFLNLAFYIVSYFTKKKGIFHKKVNEKMLNEGNQVDNFIPFLWELLWFNFIMVPELQCCGSGSGIRYLFGPRISDPGSQTNTFKSLMKIFWVKSSIILWKLAQIFFLSTWKLK